MPWKLKRTAQCEKCPWRACVNPHDIPDGYDVEKHKALASTIADPDDPMGEVLKMMRGDPQHIMACHETSEAHCIGWLANQIGDGGNLAMRMRMTDCTNANKLRLKGEQHKTFEDTLP